MFPLFKFRHHYICIKILFIYSKTSTHGNTQELFVRAELFVVGMCLNENNQAFVYYVKTISVVFNFKRDCMYV